MIDVVPLLRTANDRVTGLDLVWTFIEPELSVSVTLIAVLNPLELE